jgi:hypothetical protein
LLSKSSKLLPSILSHQLARKPEDGGDASVPGISVKGLVDNLKEDPRFVDEEVPTNSSLEHELEGNYVFEKELIAEISHFDHPLVWESATVAYDDDGLETVQMLAREYFSISDLEPIVVCLDAALLVGKTQGKYFVFTTGILRRAFISTSWEEVVPLLSEYEDLLNLPATYTDTDDYD